MPQLDPSLFATQLFWLFVAFTALFLIAWKVALPRISDVLSERQNRIDADLDRAQAIKSEAEEVLAAYEKALADAAAEAQDIRREVVQALAAERTKRQEELSRRISGQTREAESRISSEKRRAVENIRDATLEAVQSAAARLIGVEVGEADADRAIRAALGERRS
jgi:F-type H+-transporting ATPase subunit b